MCALFGWSQSSKLFNGKFLAYSAAQAASRGKDSCGTAAVTNNKKVVIHKRALHPNAYVTQYQGHLNEIAAFPAGLLHTRWATHGAVTAQNAHPFNYNGIVFAHNGVISNYRAILPSATVDSECLGPLIQDRNLTRANGSTNVLWIYRGILHAYTNEDRLKFITCDGKDGGQVTRVATAEEIIDTRIPDKDYTTLEAGVAYEVHPDGLKEVWREKVAPRYTSYSFQSGEYAGG